LVAGLAPEKRRKGTFTASLQGANVHMVAFPGWRFAYPRLLSSRRSGTGTSMVLANGDSEALSEAELADYFGGVAVLAVDGLVHRAHVVRGDFAVDGVEGRLHLRPAQ